MTMNQFSRCTINNLIRIFLCYALICLFLGINCYATGTDDGGSQAPLFSVSISGTGSSTGSGTALPDLYTGIMSYTIPIEVPPGRKGMDPAIALTYRSTNGNGWLGLGWELEMGAIQHSIRGLDYDGDNFQLRKPGVLQDLVNVGNGAYRAKIEGEFLQIKKLTSPDGLPRVTPPDGQPYWVVTNKAGMRFIFGPTAASRQEFLDSNNVTRIFKWCLEEIVDTNGNYIKFTYAKDNNGQIYLDQIEYTGNISGSLPTTNHVKFYLEDRNDAPDLYTTNFSVKTARRLKTIRVYTLSGTERVYKLSYSASISTNSSILTSVQQFGKDASVDGYGTITNEAVATKLPAILVNTDNCASNIEEKTLPSYTPSWGDSAYTWTGDFNGDGKMDIASASNGTIWVKRSTGDSFVEEVWTTSVPAWADSAHTWVADFNGDGKADIATIAGSTRSGSPFWVMVSKGDHFDVEYWTSTGANWGEAGYTWVGDFDGDGKSDIATANDGTIWVKRSTGSSFEERDWTASAPAPNWGASSYTWAADFNGDGKTDIATANGGAIWVKRSFGDHFVEETWTTTAPSWGSAEFVRLGDFNGDGKIDIATACTSPFSSCNGTIWVKLSTGTSFVEKDWTASARALNWGAYNYTWAGDFNGDGKTDIATASSGTIWVIRSLGDKFVEEAWTASAPNWGSAGYTKAGDFTGDGKIDIATASGGTFWVKQSKSFPVDLVTQVSNGTGGTTGISYTPSTQYSNLQLPFPVQTVSGITTYDGNGTISTTNYTYSGGFYYIGIERDFRGFNYAKVTGPAGPNGEQTIAETWFHQGNEAGVLSEDISTDVLKARANVSIGYMKGKPYHQKVSDVQGNKLSEVMTFYADNVSSPFYFTQPLHVDSYVYDGDTTPYAYKSTRTDYIYDGYGNITHEYQYGDYFDGSDNRTVIRTFVPNPSKYIVGLLASETIYKGVVDLVQVAKTDFYYDSVIDCSMALTNQTPDPPDKGNLTRVVKWLNGGTSPEVRMAYDDYGNLACSRDANENPPSSITYDATYTFPVVTRNPLGHPTITKYYGVGGEPADDGRYGQVKSITDPNGQATTYLYDTFGRKTKETRADETWTSWSYPDLTTTSNRYGIIGSQHYRTDNTMGLWSEDYFDGFGRTIKKKSRGPDSKTIVTDTRYDKRGAATQTSLPYFEGIETPRYKTFIYDPQGRVTQATNPDTTRVLSCYDKWVTVSIDPNNHRKRHTKDAYGRLAKVEEYQGTYNACTTEAGTPYATTTYEYDVLGNLRFVTDAKNQVTVSYQTEMRYDTLSRKTFMHDPDMGEWNYTYYPDGSLWTQTDAKTNTITFTYDELGRIKKKDYPTGVDVEYVYDEPSSTYTTYPLERLTTMTDESGTTKYFYDKLGRAYITVKTVDGTSYKIETTYDDPNRKLTLKYPEPDNETVVYEYDTGGNLWKAGGYATYAGYNALGQPGKISYGNGIVTTYQYYPTNNRLFSITTKGVSENLVNRTYTYDNKGNITDIVDHLNDALPQPPAAGTVTYAPYPGKAHAFGVTGKSFVYDPNGNMTSDGQRTITPNYDNMPQTINGTVSFVYDGTGNRVKKVAPTYTVTYIDKLYECVSGVGCGKYIFAGNDRIALKNSSGTYYYHQDHLGSTVAVTKGADTSKVDTVFYAPFGETSEQPVPPNTGVNHKYTGQELDAETGLYNYNARLYDAYTGKFITPDTIVPDPNNPQSLNRYSYALNNPLLYTDPDGHFFWVPFIVGAVVGAVSSGIQSDWDFKTTLMGTAIGAAAGTVGYGAGSWAFGAAGGEGFGALMAGGIVGGAAGGAVGGGSWAAYNGGNIGEGILMGAGFGAIGGAVTGGLLYAGVPPLFAAVGGGAAAGYAECGSRCAGESALYSLGGAVLAAGLRTYRGMDMDGKLPREGTPERAALDAKGNTYALTPEVHSQNKFWIMMGLLLGGYEHTWHTQDRLHGLYEEKGTVRYYSLIKENVPYPANAEAYLGNNFKFMSNNCTTRFGFLHPAQYFANYHYMYTRPYWWAH